MKRKFDKLFLFSSFDYFFFRCCWCGRWGGCNRSRGSLVVRQEEEEVHRHTICSLIFRHGEEELHLFFSNQPIFVSPTHFLFLWSMETKFRQARAQTSYKQLFFAGEFLNFTVDIVSQEQMLLVSKIKASQSLVDSNSTVFQ